MHGIQVVPQARGLDSYSPGLSIEEIKEKYGLSQVIKMASNENPLGTSPVVRDSLASNAEFAFRYPRSGNPELRKALASFLGIPSTCIVPGNGSDEIIDALIRILARPGVDNICAFSPCFSIYSLQSRLSGVEFRQAELDSSLCFDWEKLLDLTDEYTRIVFVTNPDNPSGYSVFSEEIVHLAQKLPAGCALIVDEAYADFARDVNRISVIPQLEKLGNVVVLRTFSKLFGLAGMRLGYGVMPEDLADCLLRVKLPFSVNILADQAGQAALRDGDFYAETRRVVLAGREYLQGHLEDLGCRVWPSQANFIMFTPPLSGRAVFRGLLERGIIVRPLDSYGFADSLRVSVGTEWENERFVFSMREIIHAG